jgi:hypothetical protein
MTLSAPTKKQGTFYQVWNSKVMSMHQMLLMIKLTSWYGPCSNPNMNAHEQNRVEAIVHI